jgi:hypothetical protein
MAGPRGFLAASQSEGRSRSPFGVVVPVIARPSFGPPLREALLPSTGRCRPLRHPSHPASVGLACRPVGAWRRHLMKQLDSNEGQPGHGHIVIDGGLAAVSRTRAGRHPERSRGVPTSGSPGERLDQLTYVTRNGRGGTRHHTGSQLRVPI